MLSRDLSRLRTSRAIMLCGKEIAVNVSTGIGVGAGKFLGVRRIFARISPNLPEMLLCNFCPQIFTKDMKTCFFGMIPKKGLTCVFLQALAAIFAWIFRDLTQIVRGFAQIFRDFAQFLNKSKLLEVRLHPASHTTVHGNGNSQFSRRIVCFASID